MYDEDGNWIGDGDEGANYYSYGNEETYNTSDQQQQAALQAAIDAAKNDADAADLNTTLGGDATADENAATSAGNNAAALQNEITKTEDLDSTTKVYTMANGTKFIHNLETNEYTPVTDTQYTALKSGIGSTSADALASLREAGTRISGSTFSKIGSDVYNDLKRAFTKKVKNATTGVEEDVTDWAKLGLGATGLAAIYDKAKTDPQKATVGYQGGIPSLVASRAEVANTYDPNRRAGSSGQRYFSNSVYSAPDKAAAVEAALGTQATALEQANKANPAGEIANKIVRTTDPTYTGMRTMTPTGTLGQVLNPALIAEKMNQTTNASKAVNQTGTVGEQSDYGSDISGGGGSGGGYGGMARGGIASARYLRGGTDGMADKIPARIGKKQPAALSHGEFVIPADVVSHLGNGNSDAGANKLYQMMDRIREARTGTKKQGKQINPDKFMPGGIVGYSGGGKVKHFLAGGSSGGVNVSSAGAAGTESNLSNWAGPAVTKMVGEAEAITAQPYKAYSGPLTAGTSSVQEQAFQNAANLTVPTGSMGGFQPSTFGATEAQNYMNPFLMASLNPQLEEARRQSQISQLGNQAKYAAQGAFGGGRSAIMEAEGQRNLERNLAGITGTGYKDAYDKAMQQFNTEQGRGLEAQTATNNYGLAAIARQQDVGASQREIEQQGITADRAQFEEEKDDPYKQLMRKQAIFQGLPISAQAAVPQAQSGAQRTAGGLKETLALLRELGVDI